MVCDNQVLLRLKGAVLMEQTQEHKKPCRSIFKNGQSTTSVNTYTKAWITLINQAEKNKNACNGTKNDKKAVM